MRRLPLSRRIRSFCCATTLIALNKVFCPGCGEKFPAWRMVDARAYEPPAMMVWGDVVDAL